jgi:hypothetical protein
MNTLENNNTEPLTVVWRKDGHSASFASLVVGLSTVLRLTIVLKKSPLHQAPNRNPLYNIGLFKKKSHSGRNLKQANPT